MICYYFFKILQWPWLVTTQFSVTALLLFFFRAQFSVAFSAVFKVINFQIKAIFSYWGSLSSVKYLGVCLRPFNILCHGHFPWYVHAFMCWCTTFDVLAPFYCTKGCYFYSTASAINVAFGVRIIYLINLPINLRNSAFALDVSIIFLLWFYVPTWMFNVSYTLYACEKELNGFSQHTKILYHHIYYKTPIKTKTEYVK